MMPRLVEPGRLSGATCNSPEVVALQAASRPGASRASSLEQTLAALGIFSNRATFTHEALQRMRPEAAIAP